MRLILFVAGIATARSLAIGLLFHLLFAWGITATRSVKVLEPGCRR